ncbi:MAG: DUF402 domain-containing protein [Actinomycetia bacterium]|nr:DUF402 domain-containing protein [Actinomycetes bacterium]
MLPPKRTVQYTKYDGTLHWRHDLLLLGEDNHGTWLGGQQGATLQRGHEPPIEAPVDFVQLIAPNVMWTAIFNSDGGKYAIYVDVTTRPQWVTRDRVELIDLDLDVVLHNNGSTELLDEDEFDHHAQLLAYPQDLIEATRRAAHDLIDQLDTRTEPFGAASQHWLATLANHRHTPKETNRGAGKPEPAPQRRNPGIP